jgi:hypothetical protein
VWDYTPRQAFAFLYFANRRRLAELSENLVVAALGAQGGGDAIKSQLREWEG